MKEEEFFDRISKLIEFSDWLDALRLCIDNAELCKSYALATATMSLGANVSAETAFEQFVANLAENAIASGANPILVLSMLPKSVVNEVADFAWRFSASRGDLSTATEIVTKFGSSEARIELAKLVASRAIEAASKGGKIDEYVELLKKLGAPSSVKEAIELIALSNGGKYIDAAKLASQAEQGLVYLRNIGAINIDVNSFLSSLFARAVLDLASNGRFDEIEKLETVAPKNIAGVIHVFALVKEVRKAIASGNYGEIPKLVKTPNDAKIALAVMLSMKGSVPRSKLKEFSTVLLELAKIAGTPAKVTNVSQISEKLIHEIVDTIAEAYGKHIAEEVVKALKNEDFSELSKILSTHPELGEVKVNGVPLSKLFNELKIYVELKKEVAKLRSFKKITPKNVDQVAKLCRDILSKIDQCPDALKLAKIDSNALKKNVEHILAICLATKAITVAFKGDLSSARKLMEEAKEIDEVPKDLETLFKVAIDIHGLSAEQALSILKRFIKGGGAPSAPTRGMVRMM